MTIGVSLFFEVVKKNETEAVDLATEQCSRKLSHEGNRSARSEKMLLPQVYS